MDFLLERFASTGEAEAFVHNDESYSYSWLLEKIDDYRNFLRGENIRGGEIVMLVSDYSPQTFALFCALMLNKNIVVPMTTESVVERETTLTLSECSRILQFTQDFEQITVKT